jgi:rod shape-determining protein MreB
MIVDLGGGTTEVAVISMGGIVVSQSIRTAGDEFDRTILEHVRDAYNLSIGERTAEDIKIKVGSAAPLAEELDVEVNGRDVLTGMPKTVRIESEEIRRALDKPLDEVTKAVKDALDVTPPDLASDLMYYGILLTGGGGLLRGLDQRLREETGVPVNVSPTAPRKRCQWLREGPRSECPFGRLRPECWPVDQGSEECPQMVLRMASRGQARIPLEAVSL